MVQLMKRIAENAKQLIVALVEFEYEEALKSTDKKKR